MGRIASSAILGQMTQMAKDEMQLGRRAKHERGRDGKCVHVSVNVDGGDGEDEEGGQKSRPLWAIDATKPHVAAKRPAKTVAQKGEKPRVGYCIYENIISAEI